MQSIFDDVQNPVLRDLFKYLNEEQVREEFEEYLDMHCDAFSGNYRKDLTGEQDLERYDIYKGYVEMLERRLDNFCAFSGLDEQEIFEHCVVASNEETEDPLASLFLDMLVSATSYETFCLNFSAFKQFREFRKSVEPEEKTMEAGEIRKKDELESKFEDEEESKSEQPIPTRHRHK